MVDVGAGGVQHESLGLRPRAVDLVQQGGEVGGDEVDDVHLERLLRSEVGRLPDGALRPVPVAPVRLGKLARVGSGIVDHLAPQVAGDLASADGHRGGGADVRVRRHRGDVGGKRDERAGGGGPRAGRRDVDDHGDVRLELLLDDLAHGGVEAAGGVEQDHDRVVSLLLAAFDRAGEVVLRDRVDVVLELDGQDTRLIAAPRRLRRPPVRGQFRRARRERKIPAQDGISACKDSISDGSTPLCMSSARPILSET